VGGLRGGYAGDEYQSLCDLQERFRFHLEATILEWAEGIETARAEREKVAA
jgi:hypothetical protein